MCAVSALSGRFGIGARPVWVECMMLPLGMRTWIGCFAGCRFFNGVLRMKKWPVVPESGIALIVDGVQTVLLVLEVVELKHV